MKRIETITDWNEFVRSLRVEIAKQPLQYPGAFERMIQNFDYEFQKIQNFKIEVDARPSLSKEKELKRMLDKFNQDVEVIREAYLEERLRN